MNIHLYMYKHFIYEYASYPKYLKQETTGKGDVLQGIFLYLIFELCKCVTYSEI